jgi:hypothetical protein
MHPSRYTPLLLLVFCMTYLTTVNADAVDASCKAASDREWCNQRRSWYDTELPKARQGDYIAQREVSFCLVSGCSGAVVVDPVAACAWLNVIAIGKKGDATDEHNLKATCSSLSDPDQAKALEQAKKMFALMPKQHVSPPLRQARSIGF